MVCQFVWLYKPMAGKTRLDPVPVGPIDKFNEVNGWLLVFVASPKSRARNNIPHGVDAVFHGKRVENIVDARRKPVINAENFLSGLKHNNKILAFH